jgi:hypothetical protein
MKFLPVLGLIGLLGACTPGIPTDSIHCVRRQDNIEVEYVPALGVGKGYLVMSEPEGGYRVPETYTSTRFEGVSLEPVSERSMKQELLALKTNPGLVGTDLQVGEVEENQLVNYFNPCTNYKGTGIVEKVNLQLEGNRYIVVNVGNLASAKGNFFFAEGKLIGVGVGSESCLGGDCGTVLVKPASEIEELVDSL